MLSQTLRSRKNHQLYLAALLAMVATTACSVLTDQPETRADVKYQGYQCGPVSIYSLECRDSNSLVSSKPTGVLQRGTYMQCAAANRQDKSVVPVGAINANASCTVDGVTYQYDAATGVVTGSDNLQYPCATLAKSTDYGATGITCSNWDKIVANPMI